MRGKIGTWLFHIYKADDVRYCSTVTASHAPRLVLLLG
jgi:hypothetical protein